MKLWIKIGVAFSLVVAVFTVSSLVIIDRRTASALLQDHALAVRRVVNHIADEIREPLEREDADAVRRELADHVLQDEEIRYLFVRDVRGGIIAHTFPGAVPDELRTIDGLLSGKDLAEELRDKGQTLHVVARIAPGSNAELHAGTSEERHQAVIRGIHRELALTGAGFLMAGAAVFFLLSYRITRPLQSVVAGMRTIGEGALDHRVPVTSRDEIGTLTQEFNEMADRIQKAEDRAWQLAQEMEEHVEERTAQLEAANKEMESFAYSVSHDLRAPLRSIDGFSKALYDDYLDKFDAEGRDHLKRVRRATERMGQLIDDMLKLSRMTRGEMLIERTDLSALAREVFRNLQASDPGRTVRGKVQEDVFGAGDRKMLRTVLENLLGNAWKYTSKQAQARIMFGAAGTGDSFAYFVKDNGAGFDMAYVQKLFAPFQRLHSESEFPGTGIGLATVQRIIHRHGGKVWAEGEVGKGATFYFTLGGGAA